MPSKPKSTLTPAAIEATAAAFLAAFKALPGKVKGRFVEMLDDYEDELDAQQLTAARAANPDDFDPKTAIPWEQVKAEIEAKRTPTSSESAQRGAA